MNCGTCGFSLYCPNPALLPPPLPPAPPPSPPIDLQCHKGRLLDCTHAAPGQHHACAEFVFKGVSWYGMEEKYALLQGLERVPMHELLDLVASNGFNALRIPLSVECVLHDCVANQFGGAVGQTNPAVHQLRYSQLLSLLIREATRRHLLVLLDMHRLSAGDRNNPLWHDGAISEAELIRAWEKLAHAHCASHGVVGADLFNEPWAAAWGHGADDQDWAAAAERIGSAVSRACPRWLLFVEGVSHTTASGEAGAKGQSAYGHNWASNLEGLHKRPLGGLPEPSKLVLSPHIYGPSVAPQPYFEDKDFPANMEPICACRAEARMMRPPPCRVLAAAVAVAVAVPRLWLWQLRSLPSLPTLPSSHPPCLLAG